MNFSALLMLCLSYETNSLLVGLTNVSRGHTGSKNGAECWGGVKVQRGQESPQQRDCIMRKLFQEEEGGKKKISNLNHMGMTA